VRIKPTPGVVPSTRKQGAAGLGQAAVDGTGIIALRPDHSPRGQPALARAAPAPRGHSEKGHCRRRPLPTRNAALPQEPSQSVPVGGPSQ